MAVRIIASICLRAAVRLAQPVETGTCCFGQAAGAAVVEGAAAALAPVAARSAPQKRRTAAEVRRALLKVRESYPAG